jgi:thiamine pyrophosphokinase
VLGNIELLGIGLELGVEIELLDANNRIRMTDHGMVLKKEEQFGKYVSLIPYTAQVEHLYLAGFKYPLADYCLKGFCSIGVSNEITEEQAEITFENGILIVIESRDDAAMADES